MSTDIKQDNLHKELDLIQALITRMANNSFLIKGWVITIMSALVVLGKELFLSKPDSDNKMVVIFYLAAMLSVLISFWWLDSFYLYQERIFRAIYEKAIADPNAANRTRYNLSPRQKIDETDENSLKISQSVDSVWNILATDFMKWFYVPFLLFIIIALIVKIIV